MTSQDRAIVHGAVRIFHAQARMAGVTLIALGETQRCIAAGGLVDSMLVKFGVTDTHGLPLLIEGLRLKGFDVSDQTCPMMQGVMFSIAMVNGPPSNIEVWFCGVNFRREEKWNVPA